MLKQLKRRIRNIFIAGLLVTIPIAFTFFLLNFLFKNLDRALSPVFTKALIFFGAPVEESFRIPGVGVVMTLIIIFLVGVFTTNIFGKKLVNLGEKILQKIPVVRSIYTGTKQVVSTIVDADVETFSKVVLVEFPRRELFAIGFITCENKGEVQARTEKDVVNVFVPTTPNPTSGFLVFAPKDQIIELSMTIEEGVKYAVSGGIISPPYHADKHLQIKTIGGPEDVRDLTI